MSEWLNDRERSYKQEEKFSSPIKTDHTSRSSYATYFDIN